MKHWLRIVSHDEGTITGKHLKWSPSQHRTWGHSSSVMKPDLHTETNVWGWRENKWKEEPASVVHLWGSPTGRRGLGLSSLTFTLFLQVRCEKCLNWDTCRTSNHARDIQVKHLENISYKMEAFSRPGFRQPYTAGSLNSTLAFKYCMGPSKALHSLVVWNQSLSFTDRNSH